MNTALPPSLPPSLSLSLSHSLSLSRSFPYSRLFPPFPPTRSNKPSKDRQSSSQTDSQTDSHTLLTRTKKHSNTFEQAQIHSLERSKIHPYEQRKARTNTPHTLIWLLNYSKIYPQQSISSKLTIFAINNNTHTHTTITRTHANQSIDRPTAGSCETIHTREDLRFLLIGWAGDTRSSKEKERGVASLIERTIDNTAQHSHHTATKQRTMPTFTFTIDIRLRLRFGLKLRLRFRVEG